MWAGNHVVCKLGVMEIMGVTRSLFKFGVTEMTRLAGM